MKIEYHSRFRKHFKKRILPHPNLVAKFQERVHLLITNPTNYLLRSHPLLGRKSEYRSFSISGDIRAIYKIKDDTIRLYDIGTHNQVY